jgi:pimeloyl-ACP methyl ester carboxylesterase
MIPESIEERLVFFPFGATSLAGILAVPAEPNGRTVLIPWGGGAYPSSGRNRLRTRLARTLAEQGFHSFRFDYRGVGESDGDYRRPDMAAPNTEEVVAACAWLASQGLPRIVIVAHCFGAWSSLMAAPMIPGLEGMALINAPVRRDHEQMAGAGSWRWWASHLRKLKLSKLRSAERRARYRKLVAAKASSLVGSGSSDTRYARAVGFMVDRRIPVLLIYGEDGFRADLELEADHGLRAAIERAGPPTRLVTVSERLQGCASLAAQDVLLKEVVPWLHELPGLSP